MSIVELIEQYNIYRRVAVRMDLCTIGVNLCILIILLLQTKNANKKIKYAFILHIGLVIFTLLVEITSWCTLFNSEYLLLFKIASVLDFFLIWIIPVTTFNLVINIIEYKVSFNKLFVRIFFILFFVFGALIFIPPFQKQIIVFNDEIVAYKITKYNYYFFLAESILIIIGLGLGLSKAKKIGVRDTIIVSFFIVMSFISCYIDEWWSSTVGMLFITYSLMILFGITYQTRLINAREKEKEKQIELSETKMRLLLTQIQPHFLYNTLSTLKYLCETSPKEASSLCDDFSGYLRANIDAINDDGLVTFDKELKNIENYLKIEKARFDERVKYVFDIQARDFVVPVLSLQTIVENAVKKGICKKIEGGTITVSTKNIGDFIEIKIADDGVGFDMKTYMSDGKNHVGLTNTKQRLELIKGTISVESYVDKGTTVTVVIPKGEEL